MKYANFGLHIFFVLAVGSLSATSTQAAQVEVGFSPEGSAETLVVNVIQKAQQQVLLMGYSFTSPKVVKALIAAKQRGLDVRIVLDARGNEGKSSRAAMNLIANAGIPLRTDDAYKIQHDKVIITDGQNVETGSFNYSTAAARSNSENALVLWGRRKWPRFTRSIGSHVGTRGRPTKRTIDAKL